MYERIMVPLDGSSTAEIALPYAHHISTAFGAEILLVSVVEPAAAESDRLYSSYLKGITEQIQNQSEVLKAKKEAKVRSQILPGKPADEILRFANENKVDLVVMASRGRSGHGPWSLGNIAAKVLRASNKPVMLIKASAKKEALEQRRLVRKILVPLDGSKAGEHALPQAEALAKALDAELVLFQAYELQMAPVMGEGYFTVSETVLREDSERRKALAVAYLGEVEKGLKQKGLRSSKAVVMGLPAEQILDYADAEGMDLIAMSTHGRSGVRRWVFGSVTDKVLHAGNTPVLAVRAAVTL